VRLFPSASKSKISYS